MSQLRKVGSNQGDDWNEFLVPIYGRERDYHRYLLSNHQVMLSTCQLEFLSL